MPSSSTATLAELPVVLADTRPDVRSRQLRVRVRADQAVFDGHFAGRPILAGVVQLDWAWRLAGLAAAEGQICELRALRFERPIVPPADLELQLQRDPEAATLRFTWLDGRGQRCSSGTFVLERP